MGQEFKARSGMKPSLVYCCPTEEFGPQYAELSERFVSTFLEYPPNHDFELVVVSNGGPPSPETLALFSGFPVRFIEHDNTGFDIGAFQLAASQLTGELAVFFGVSTYFKRPGWLRRMADSFHKHGDTLYGAMGNQGNMPCKVWPHIRTNAFWISPGLMNLYPVKITKAEQRYEFEHGETCLTSWILNQKKRAWIVSFDGECPLYMCDLMAEGYHKGNQENLLVGDRMTTAPFY
jgi:hypothetical protein